MESTVKPRMCIHDHKRRAFRGQAMIEFLLTLTIMLFVVAFAIYLAMGLWGKEATHIEVRHRLWRQSDRSWWHHDAGSWSGWDGDANGDVPSGARGGDRPRGRGESLDYLYDEAGREAEFVTRNNEAKDYFRRIWNNLPGRHHRRVSHRFETGSRAFSWMDGTVASDYFHDSVSWTHDQEPPWLIAMYGPMSEIETEFKSHLDDVPAPFRRMRDEVYHAWFEEEWLLNWSHPNAQLPTD